MLLTSTLENIGILDAAIVAILGYVVVFFLSLRWWGL